MIHQSEVIGLFISLWGLIGRITVDHSLVDADESLGTDIEHGEFGLRYPPKTVLLVVGDEECLQIPVELDMF